MKDESKQHGVQQDSLESRNDRKRKDDQVDEQDLQGRLLSIGLLRANEVGNLALLASISKDMDAYNQLSSHESVWTHAIKKTLDSHLADGDSIKVKKDEVLAGELPSCHLQYFLTKPNSGLDVSVKNNLRAVRASVLIYHLNNQYPLADSLSRTLSALFKGTGNDAKELAESFVSIEIHHLQHLQNQCELGDKWYKLLSSIIQALRAPEGEIRRTKDQPKVTKKIIPINRVDEDVLSLPKAGGEDSVSPERKVSQPHQIPESGNLLAYQMNQISHASPKDFSGVDGQYSRLREQELRAFLPVVIVDYANSGKTTSDREITLAIIVSFLLRSPVHCFNMVKLLGEAGASAWLDLEAGHFCWDRRMATQESTNESIPLEGDLVRIPLPLEVAEELLFRKEIYSGVRNLGELFRMPLGQLKKETKRYLYEQSLTSHTPSLTRLSESLGRFVLACCEDEVYSAAVGTDFTLGTKANFNYVVLQPDRINQVVSLAYERLGFSGKLLSPIGTFAGSSQGMKVTDVLVLLNDQAIAAIQSYGKLNTRTSLEELVDIHYTIARAVLAIAVVMLGLRPAKEYSFANHTIDLQSGLALITDKASSQYLENRLIPIPRLLIAWLTFYKNFLTTLARRLESKNRNLAQLVSTIAVDICRPGDIPLFFHILGNEVRPLGSGDLSELFSSYELEVNVGRHFLDRILRNKTGSALINMMMGRAEPGQEAFGRRSALAPIDGMTSLRNLMDAEIDVLGIQAPPDVNRARFTEHLSRHICSPGLWGRERAVADNGTQDETCPFHEFTLMNLTSFECIVEAWMSQALEASAGEVLISLLLADGVLHIDELLEGALQLVQGRIYRSGDRYWVNTSTQSLGVRRIELSLVTMQLAAKACLKKLSECNHQSLKEDAERAAGALLRRAGVDIDKEALESLIEMSLDFYSTKAPGPIREWMAGRMHAKTSRIETVARHLLNGIEPLTDKHKLRRRPCIIDYYRPIMDSIQTASLKDRNHGRNEYRLNELEKELQLLEGVLTGVDQLVLVRYALYLISKCPNVKSPASVERHCMAVREFVREICKDIEGADELKSIDLEPLVKGWQEDHKISKADQAAFNYLLKHFEQDFRLVGTIDPASATRTFSEIPSTHEIGQALKLLSEKQSGRSARLSMCMLHLMSEHSLRAEDVASLRTIDVHSGTYPHIVITARGTGTKKSRNANRVLVLSESTAQALSQVSKLRSNAYPDHEKISLFGTTSDPESFEGADELLGSISQALVAATGSSALTPHSLRHMVATSAAHEALVPADGQGSSELKQRQALIALAVRAGHGDFQTTFMHYVHDVDILRRKWVDKLIWENFCPSPKFVAGLVGRNEKTVRGKMRSGFSMEMLRHGTDHWPPIFLSRIFDLKNFIADGVSHYKLDDVLKPVDPLFAAARFMTAKMLGVSDGAAALVTDFHEESLSKLNTALSVFTGATGTIWQAHNKFHFDTVDQMPRLQTLVQQAGAWVISLKEVFELARCISKDITKSWGCSREQLLLLQRSGFFSNIQAAGFEIIVSVPDLPASSTSNAEAEASELGVTHVRTRSERRFPRGVTHRLAFVFKGDAEESWPRRMPSANFIVSTFVIAQLCTYIETTRNPNAQ